MKTESVTAIEVGRRLRFIREKNGMTNYQIQKATGISESSLRAYEAGSTSPSIKVVVDLCHHLISPTHSGNDLTHP